MDNVRDELNSIINRIYIYIYTILLERKKSINFLSGPNFPNKFNKHSLGGWYSHLHVATKNSVASHLCFISRWKLGLNESDKQPTCLSDKEGKITSIY